MLTMVSYSCEHHHGLIIQTTWINTKILQGLGVAQAAVTERWPRKEEKTPKKISFFS